MIFMSLKGVERIASVLQKLNNNSRKGNIGKSVEFSSEFCHLLCALRQSTLPL